jgi:chaperone required for assembly of F1-ATPase
VKRFYKDVGWRAAGEGFEVTLDGRPVRTPRRRPIHLPSEPLAQAVAGEWEDQTDEIRPETMPLTRLVTTALDRVAGERPVILQDLAAYAASDLVCYRAEAPVELVARQAERWQPLVDWVRYRYDAALAVTSGVIPVSQPQTALALLTAALQPLPDLEIMALHTVTTATGSLVIGLALLEGEIDGEAAWAAGLADELYMFEVWGEDAEAKRRHDALRRDILAAERLLHLIGRLPAGALAVPQIR